jgi:hypothetical protein
MLGADDDRAKNLFSSPLRHVIVDFFSAGIAPGSTLSSHLDYSVDGMDVAAGWSIFFSPGGFANRFRITQLHTYITISYLSPLINHAGIDRVGVYSNLLYH